MHLDMYGVHFMFLGVFSRFICVLQPMGVSPPLVWRTVDDNLAYIFEKNNLTFMFEKEKPFEIWYVFTSYMTLYPQATKIEHWSILREPQRVKILFMVKKSDIICTLTKKNWNIMDIPDWLNFFPFPDWSGKALSCWMKQCKLGCKNATLKKQNFGSVKYT